MQKLVFLVALLLVPVPLRGVNEIKSFSFDNYDLMLSETGLTLSKGMEEIVTISNLSFKEIRLPGIWEIEHKAERYDNVSERKDGFSFEIGEQNTVNVTFVDDGLWFNVSSPHLVQTSYSGADLWYGGGSLLNQSFPLKNVELNPLSDIIFQALPDPLKPIMPAMDRALPPLYDRIFPFLMHFAPPALSAFMGLENDLMITRPFGYNFQTPFWLSRDFGVFLNTTEPIEYSIENSVLNLGVHNYSAKIILGEEPEDIFMSFISMVGKPSEVIPLDVIRAPIWTIGSQYGTDFDQEEVLEYARKIAESNLGHSVITIDVGWQREHGDTDFDLSRFPNPKAMVDELHSLGFRVILWTVPYVSSTSENYREGFDNGYFIKNPYGLPIHIPWSYVAQIVLDALHFKFYTAAGELTKPLCSAVIDLSDPEAFEWYVKNLQFLVDSYGIDGFKMDQGEAAFLPEKGVTYANITVNDYTDLCTEVGESFEYYEIRSGWFSQSHGGWAREYDKFASWDEKNGIKSVIPEALTLSMLGYPYVLPDAVGGGQFFNEEYDEELYIRWVELAAFMPIMQFSTDFFNQSEKAQGIAAECMRAHEDLYPYLAELAEEAAETGMPVVRPLFFEYSDEEECYSINDQYLLGSDMLVAPVLEQGARAREVYLPEGLWRDYWSGEIHDGGERIDCSAPLDRIPVFIRLQQGV
ncbi:MAG: glycoside hydrolase family 31 protein [Candidatus Thermoplasmatota archaeon]|nr:glycoside hydrolase family 31 protein [Candidatus Thermoplasmatota archaeon]